MGLLIDDRRVAVPGETIAEGEEFTASYGTRKYGNKVLANRLGIVSVRDNTIKLINLNGKYLPKVGDTIVCRVTDILISGWRVDTNSPYSAVLSLKEATNEFIPKGTDLKGIINIGDFICVKVIGIVGQNLVDISMKGPGLRKLHGGRIIDVNCYKVPRIIGKNGSMIQLIKQHTNCRVVVGQNGKVWIQGSPEDELIATRAIRKIEKESHTSGLTDRMKEHFEKIYADRKPTEDSNDEEIQADEDSKEEQ